MQSIRKISSYLTYNDMALGTGSLLAGINFGNYRRSPMYKTFDSMSTCRIFAFCVIKGTIYGVFWPVSLLGITLDTCSSTKAFNNHFIPGRVYGITFLKGSGK